MADELTIKVSAKLDEGSVSAMQSQLDGIGKNKKDGIKLKLDVGINKQIANLKKQLNDISAKTYPIKFQIDQTAISNIQNLTDSLNRAVANVQSSVSRQATNVSSGLLKNGYTGVSKVIQRGKMDELNGFEATSEIEKSNLALGETLTIFKEREKAIDGELGQLKEVSRQYETNYELQAKEAAKAHDQQIKEEARYRSYIEKENEKALKEQSKIQEQQRREEEKAQKERERSSSMYAGLYDQIDRKEAQEEKKARDYERREREKALKEEERLARQQQKEQERIQSERDREQSSLSSFFIGKGEDTDRTIANWKSKIEDLYTDAFKLENPLTGEFAKPVDEAINTIRQKVSDLENSGVLVTSKMKDQINSEIKAIGRLYEEQYDKNYPDTKQKSVDTRESIERYTSRLNKSENELQKMGMLSEQLKANIDEVRQGFASVGQEDSDSLGQWVDKFGTLQQKIAEFKSSVEGQSMKLNFEIESDKLSQIDTLTEKLNSLPNSLSGSGVAAAKEELAALATEYQNVMSQLQSGDLTQEQFNSLAKQAEELNNRLGQVANAAKIFNDGFKNTQDVQKYEQRVSGIRDNFEKLQRTYADLIQKNPEIATRFEEIGNHLQNIDPMSVGTVSSEVTNLGRACSNAAGEASGLRGALEGAFGGVGQYLARFTSAFYIINKSIQTIKSMVNEVTELDTSLMELQKVTSLSGDSLAQFTDNAYKTGKEVGRTGKDVIDAVTTFSRAGYNLEESNQLAKAALTMTNVGVDIPSTEAAASDMISILKAFNKQADESMQVIDELYNVANKEPLDFGNITQMLVTAGGTLAQTNTSLEESMGLLTGGFATLRNSSVANGLIQISQRLRGVKEDGEAIEEEGFMPKLKKAFGDAGVAIEDQNGELRSTYDILHDLAGQWDTLSSKQRQYLGEKAAGTRQVKVLNAIMANWDVVEDTIQKANEATGEATKGNEKYLDSIEGRITQFKSAFSDLARTTIDSGFVKGIVSIGTTILNITKNLGGLVPILTTLGGLIVVFSGAKIASGFSAIGTAIKNLIPGLTGMIAAVKSGTSAWAAFQAVLATPAGMIGGAIALIGIIASVVSIVGNLKKSTAEQAATANQNYQSQKTKVEDLNTELENTQKLMSDMSGRPLTVVEQDEYDRLKKTNDELQRRIDLENTRLEITEREAREASAKAGREYNETPQYIEDTAAFRYLGPEFTARTLDKNRSLYSDESIINAPISNEKMFEFQTKALIEAKKEYQQAEQEFISTDSADTKKLEELEQKMEDSDKVAQDARSWINDYLSKLEELTNGISRVENPTNERDRYFNHLLDLQEEASDVLLFSSMIDESKGKQAEYILGKYTEEAIKAKETIEEKGQITPEDLIADGTFKEIIAEFEKYGWSIDEVATHLTQFYKEQANAPDFVSSFDELIKNNYLATESYKALTEAMAEQEKAGTISAETFKKITADKELANYLQNTEGALRITANGLELNTEAMQDYIAIQNGKDRIEALALMQKDIALLEETQAAMQGLTDESEYAQKLDESNALQNEINALQAYVLQLDNATSALSRYQNAKKTSNEDAAFNVGESIYKEIKEGRKTGKTGTDDFKDAVGFILGPNWQEEFSENIEQAYSEAEKLGKRYFGQSDERTGMTNFMKDLAKATDEEGNAIANFNAKTGEFKLNTKANGESYSLEEISSALGIYSEAVSSLFGLMETYDYDVDYEPFVTPEDQKAIDEYNAKIEAQEQAVNDAKESQIKATDELAKAEEAYNSQRTKENQEALDAAKKQKEAADELVEQQQGQLESLQNGTAEPVETMSAQDALNLYNKFQDYAENGIPIKFIPQYQEVEEYLISLGVIEPKNVDIEATDKTEDGVRSAEENVNSVEQDKPIDLEGNADGVVEAANVANNAIEGIEKNPDATKLDADPTGVEEGVNAADQAMSNIDKPEPIILSARLDGTFSAIKATISGWVESIKGLIKGIGEEWEKSNKEAEEYWAQQRKWRQELNPPPDESGKPEPKQEPPEQPITSNGNNGIPSQEEVSVGAKLEEGSGNQLKNDLQQEMDDSGPVETEVQATTEPAPTPSPTSTPSSTPAPIEMPVEASSDAGSTIREQTQEQLDSQPPVKEQVVQQPEPAQTTSPNETKFELDLGNIDSVQDQVGQIAEMSDELAGMASEAGASAGSINALNDACAELITATSDLGSIDMGDPASVEAASSSISTAASNFNDAYNKLSAEIDTMQTVNVGANTSSAEASIDALSNKTVTVTVVTNEVPGNAKGTRSADPGLSLVDEKGAELIEHTRRGTYELGTNNGPRITNLEAGDVVHTASETKRILSRMAKVGGFFRDGLNQAKSVLTGGAFANPKKNKYNIETKSLSNPLRVSVSGKNSNAVKSSSSKKSGTKKSSSKKSGGSKTPDIKKLQEWFEKLFDWAEVRLDRLQRKTNEWIYSAGQAIGYAAQNAQLSGAMKSVEDQIRDTTAAMKLYEDQAEKVRKKTKLTDATIEKIQNGTIDISSYSKNSQERIRQYTEWYEKMLNCKEALQDLNEQQKELATQKLDNVIKSFEDRANVYENTINRRSAQMNLNTAMGIEEQESDYAESITAANNQLKTYVQEREALNNELNSLVAQGYIKKDSEEWFEYQGKIADLDTTIINTKESIIELHDAANQVNLTKLGYQLDALTNSASHLDEMISLRQAQANEEYADSYKTLIDNGMDQIKNLQAQNEEYRKQQQGLDKMSEKYQELEANIQSNISAINQMKTSQEGWNDSVYDIQIDKINDFKDQLSKTNDLYERQKNLQDAIQELEKAQNQRTQRVFREGGLRPFVW